MIRWCCLLVVFPLCGEVMDLEEFPDPWVVELKQIEVPGFPDAFNPSIVRYEDKYLMSFRNIPSRKDSFTSYLGLVFLDANFQIVGEPQILPTRLPGASVPSRAADGRLIWVGKELYIIYDDNEDPVLSKSGFRVFIGKIGWDGERFTLEKTEKITQYEGADPMLREKSWTPFVYESGLLLSYSIVPHRIFAPLLGQSCCDTVAETSATLDWPWGTMRGGTPALQGIAAQNEYLSFFHSSIRMESEQSEGKMMLHYFIGAFTFSPSFPFPITRVSPFPIIAKKFYSGPAHQHYWHPLRVVFPGGFVFDNQYIYLFYGRQDHEIWMAKIEKEGLLKSLIAVD